MSTATEQDLESGASGQPACQPTSPLVEPPGVRANTVRHLPVDQRRVGGRRAQSTTAERDLGHRALTHGDTAPSLVRRDPRFKFGRRLRIYRTYAYLGSPDVPNVRTPRDTSLFALSRLTTDGAAGCRGAEMRQRNEAPQRARRVELVEAPRSEVEGGGSSSIPAERRVVSHTRVAAQDRVRPGAGDRRNRPPEPAVRSRTPRNRRAREAAVRRSLLVARSISGLDHGIRTRPGRRCTTGAAIQPGESQAGEGRGAGS